MLNVLKKYVHAYLRAMENAHTSTKITCAATVNRFQDMAQTKHCEVLTYICMPQTGSLLPFHSADWEVTSTQHNLCSPEPHTCFLPFALARVSRSLFLRSNMASAEERMYCSGRVSLSGGSRYCDDPELIVLRADLMRSAGKAGSEWDCHGSWVEPPCPPPPSNY